MSSLRNKTIVIIGGSSGFGLRIAQLAAAEGAYLILGARNTARLEAAKKSVSELGASGTEIYQVDAHDSESLESFFQKIPVFDHLVSMIGDVMGGGFLSAEMEKIRQVIESKFFTNVRIGQLAAKKIKENGSLVFTSGTGGRAQDACGSYVGNLGINALVEGLAAELAPRGRVNAVSPTWTLTPFWKDVPQEQVNATKKHFEQTIPLKRLAKIDDLASAYIFLMKNDFITGQHIAVDGGIMLGS